MPSAVLNEINVKPSGVAEQVETLVANQTFQIHRASQQTLNDFPEDMGAGEREALAIATDMRADLVVLDDQQGRRIARERGLAVTGTVGVLIEARARELIPSVRHKLDRLIEAGMWINESFYHRVVQEFGE